MNIDYRVEHYGEQEYVDISHSSSRSATLAKEMTRLFR